MSDPIEVLREIVLGGFSGYATARLLYKPDVIAREIKLKKPELFRKTADAIVYRKGSMAIAVDSSGDIIAKQDNHSNVIQGAIDYVSSLGGGIIYIAPGIYEISSPIVFNYKARVWLMGAGASWYNVGQGTTLKAIEDIETIIDMKQQFAMVTDLYIHGNELASYGIKMGGADSMIQRVLVHKSNVVGIFIYGNWNHWIEDSWVESIGNGNGDGIEVSTSGEGLTFIGKVHFFNVYNAIRLDNCDRVFIAFNEQKDGRRFIRFQPGFTQKYVIILGNISKNISDVFAEFSGTSRSITMFANKLIGENTKHFLRISDNASLTNINIYGNIADAIVSTPIDGDSSKVYLGFNIFNNKPTINGGVSVISAGSTRVTVTHKLASIPSKILVTPYGNARIWVENITSTTFDIVTDTAPANDLTVAWYAEI